MNQWSWRLRWVLAAAIVTGVAGCGGEKKVEPGAKKNETSVPEPKKTQKQSNAAE